MNPSNRLPPLPASAGESGPGSLRAVGIREIVIVDPATERYPDFVEAARAGDVGLHFCVDGGSAVRLARRFRADVWLVARELPDLSGFDLLEILSRHVQQGSVDPLLSGSRISLDHIGQGMRSGIFIVADAYALEDEQRALASGVAGYLVRPVTVATVRGARNKHDLFDSQPRPGRLACSGF